MAKKRRNTNKEEKYETRTADPTFKLYIDEKATEAAGRPVAAQTVNVGGTTLYQYISEEGERKILNHKWQGDGISYHRFGPLPADLNPSGKHTTAYMSFWICNGREWRPVVSKKKKQTDKTLFDNLIDNGVATQAEVRFRVFEGDVLKQCWSEPVAIPEKENDEAEEPASANAV